MRNKVLVCITPQSNGKRLIDKSYELSKSIDGELHILHVEKGDNIFASPESPAILQWLFSYGAEKGGETHAICGDDIATVISEFIKRNRITHAVFGEAPAEAKGNPIVEAIQRRTRNINIVVIEKE